MIPYESRENNVSCDTVKCLMGMYKNKYGSGAKPGREKYLCKSFAVFFNAISNIIGC